VTPEVSWAGWLLDGVVVLLLVGLALRLLHTRDLFEAVVLFVAYGLTLALAWMRVGAPDLALAEAALGAGVTGALFLNAWRRLSRRAQGVELAARPLLVDDPPTPGRKGTRALAALLAAGSAAALGALYVAGRPDRAPILPSLVADHLAESGVSNPVTAVLLNFRSYDTLLEVAVLVAAMIAVWSLDRRNRELTREEDRLADPALSALARIVVPMVAVTAVYLTWAGTSATGGAFQAGALLAGAGVLLTAAGFMRPPTAAWEPVRLGAAVGVYVFVGVGLGVIPWTGVFLAWPEGAAYPLILGIEAVLTVSIAVVLVELFVDVPSVPDPDPRLEGIDPTGDPLGRLFEPEPVADVEEDAGEAVDAEAKPAADEGATP
jgi:multisubunit Na+/H+ antiporter MnhB subunit